MSQCYDIERPTRKELLATLREIADICKAGIIETRETGKPTWSALDHMQSLARAVLAKAGE